MSDNYVAQSCLFCFVNSQFTRLAKSLLFDRQNLFYTIVVTLFSNEELYNEWELCAANEKKKLQFSADKTGQTQ